MNEQLLQNNWQRSYQEDSETEIVFRRDDFQFPPPKDRLGRASIKLEPDKTFSQRGNIFRKEGNLMANDSFTNVNGSWDLFEETIRLFADGGNNSFELKISSLQEDKLVLQRQ